MSVPQVGSYGVGAGAPSQSVGRPIPVLVKSTVKVPYLGRKEAQLQFPVRFLWVGASSSDVSS